MASVLNSLTTFLIVVGYALEVSKIGIAASEETGLPYFPVYKMAPLRILVTFIGVILAFIFTMVPFPITSKEVLRQDIARQFQLLSTMYSITQNRLSTGMDPDPDRSRKVSMQSIALQARCRENLSYTRWEQFHRFPKNIYIDILDLTQSIHDFYVLQNDAMSRLKGNWLHAMVAALGPEFYRPISHQTILLLTILSGAISLNVPIPPFLEVPRSALFHVLQTERQPKEMSLEHVEESGYAVFAAISVSSQLAGQEIQRCVDAVRNLVGEVSLQLP